MKYGLSIPRVQAILRLKSIENNPKLLKFPPLTDFQNKMEILLIPNSRMRRQPENLRPHLLSSLTPTFRLLQEEESFTSKVNIYIYIYK